MFTSFAGSSGRLTDTDTGELSDFTLCFGRKSLSRSAFVTTQTELKLMASAPNMGVSRNSEKARNTPAASGMPMLL